MEGQLPAADDRCCCSLAWGCNGRAVSGQARGAAAAATRAPAVCPRAAPAPGQGPAAQGRAGGGRPPHFKRLQIQESCPHLLLLF